MPTAPATLVCCIRRKPVAATPEEQVRQWLLEQLLDAGYPRHLIAVERQIVVHGKRRRFDVLVFGRDGRPWLLAECKAPTEALNALATAQALSYCSVTGAHYLLLTNGHTLHTLHLPTGTAVSGLPAL